jgi:hypothetical protein
MALVADPEVALCEDSGTTPGQSFDCEDDGTSRPKFHKNRAAKVAASILLSLGVVLLMALVGTPGALDPQSLRKFAVSGVTPARVPTSSSSPKITPVDDKHAIAELPPNVPPPRAASPTMLSSSQAQVAMLFTIMGFGKILQGRFPGKEANVVQKLLLQFIVPATLFKGLSL